MITINLLPWREELRRKRRRHLLLALGGVVSLILMTAWMGRVWVIQEERGLHQKLLVLSSLQHQRAVNREQLETALAQQAKRLAGLRQQKIWREGFACPLRWLGRLASQLPSGCVVDKVVMRDNQLRLVLMARQGLSIEELIGAVASIKEWQQVRVHRLKSDGQKNLIKMEFNAVVHCGDGVK